MSSNTSSNMSNQVYRQKEATKQQASSLLNRILGFIDRVIPPQTRQQFFKNTQAFASDQPLLASFLATQLLLAALPLLLFISFTLATLGLSILAAAAFSIFWIGTALLVLVPTLLVTFSAGVFVWLWAVGTYLFCRAAYNTAAYLRSETREPRHKAMRTLRDEGEHVRERVGDLGQRAGGVADKVGGQVSAMGSQVRSAVNGVKSSVEDVVKNENGAAEDLAPGVPEVVKRSFGRAHQSPEAAADETMVGEKQQLEDELLNRVPKEDSMGRQGLGGSNATRYNGGASGLDGMQQLKSPFAQQQMATS